jgi:hypothetical protein
MISLLTGCKSKDNENNEYATSLSKSQKIEISVADSPDVYLIDEKKDIEAFIKKITADKWELKELPEEAELAREYIFYQSDTVKLMDRTNNKDEVKEAAKIITYKDLPYIKFTMNELEFSFLISEETAQYLNTLGN